MNHMSLIRRAWDITWRHRVLWLFGVLLALAGGSGGGNGSANGVRYALDAGHDPLVPSLQPLPRLDPEFLLAIATLCCCLLLFLGLGSLILRYVANAALYQMVDRIAAGSPAPGWRAGFRLGWGPRTWRLFLLDLVVWLPFTVAALVLLALAAAPLLLMIAGGDAAVVLAVLFTIGIELLAIGLLVVAGAVLGVVMQFGAREVVLGDRSVGTALAAGWALARGRLRDTAVMALLMFAIGLGFSLVLVPILLVVLVTAVVVGGGLGYAVYAATHSLFWATAAGLPPGLLVLLVPMICIQGLYLAFSSAAWTLAYREMAQVSPRTPDSASGQ